MVRLLSVNPNSPYQPWARSHSRGGRGRLQPPPGGETRPACWRMKALRRDLVDPKITEHEGRIVDIRRGERRERVVCRASQPVDASTRVISIGSAGLVPLCQCALPLKTAWIMPRGPSAHGLDPWGTRALPALARPC